MDLSQHPASSVTGLEERHGWRKAPSETPPTTPAFLENIPAFGFPFLLGYEYHQTVNSGHYRNVPQRLNLCITEHRRSLAAAISWNIPEDRHKDAAESINRTA